MEKAFPVLPSPFSGQFKLVPCVEISGALLVALKPLVGHLSLEFFAAFCRTGGEGVPQRALGASKGTCPPAPWGERGEILVDLLEKDQARAKAQRSKAAARSHAGVVRRLLGKSVSQVACLSCATPPE